MKRFLSLSFAVVALGSVAMAQHGHGNDGKAGQHGPPDFAKAHGQNKDDDMEATNRGGKKFAGAPCVMSRKHGVSSGYTNSSFRSGTYHYDNGLHKGQLKFHGYAEAFDGKCAPSPWYDYSNMPAYVETAHLRVSVERLFDFEAGASYSYQPHHYAKFDQGRLDSAADRMNEAFRGYDFDRMSWLVDNDSWVQVQVGDADHYDMRGGDFKNVMKDLVDETSTASYRVKSTRSWDGGASVVAEHNYVDPWGQRKTALHSYGLKLTDHGYRLVSFRSESR